MPVQPTSVEPNVLRMFNHARPLMPNISQSASGMMDSVERMFGGVEGGRLIHIIENQFKPTDIYRVLASEKE